MRAALVLAALALLGAAAGPAAAFDQAVLQSVVRVLPRHEDAPPQPQGPGPTQEPEGTAVAVDPHHLVTAAHVLAGAEGVEVGLADGRVIPAEIVGRDRATDLAVLRVARRLPPLVWGPAPAMGDEVCVVGNAFGLGLSLACGVVSQTGVTHAGFNPIEDFIQVDAAVNPGMSGGPLLDAEDRLVGVVTGIFTKRSDANIGVNFASARALVERVAEDLLQYGEVRRTEAGVRFAPGPRPAGADGPVGAEVARAAPGGAAAAAGLRSGDVVTRIGDRRTGRGSAARTAIQLHRPGDSMPVTYWRDGGTRRTALQLPPWSD